MKTKRPRRLTIEVLKERFLNKGLRLLESQDIFIKSNTELTVLFTCGHVDKLQWERIRKGKNIKDIKLCTKCKPIRIGNPNIVSYSRIMESCNAKGLKLITTEEEYTNFKSYHQCRVNIMCINNHITNRRVSHLMTNKIHIFGKCRKCHLDSWSNPETNPSYIDGRTKNYIGLRDEKLLKPWKKNIFRRDDHKCIICDDDKNGLRAHHLNGYNWDIKNRFNLDNGVTLCIKHHDEFHHIYLLGNNTLEQFQEYYLNIKNAPFIQRERSLIRILVV